ncbi:MAG: hypothetical protein QGH63_08000 [Rhodospirillales bacterium]|nr:hypothetical protein [Rhodospirillales bacterium]
MNDTPPNEVQDAAWVTIETPFNADWLEEFIGDIERLYRINSLMEFQELRQTSHREYHLDAKNLSNGKTLETNLSIIPGKNKVQVIYSTGLKTSTKFRINLKPGGKAELVITDEYGGTSAKEREARIDEADKSLVQWGRDIHRYLRLWKRWSRVPGWKWYMRRVWQPLKPSARRISFMLIMITLVEFIIFLIIFAIFWLELYRYVD